MIDVEFYRNWKNGEKHKSSIMKTKQLQYIGGFMLESIHGLHFHSRFCTEISSKYSQTVNAQFQNEHLVSICIAIRISSNSFPLPKLI